MRFLSLFQSVFFAHNFRSCDSSFKVHSGVQVTDKAAAACILRKKSKPRFVGETWLEPKFRNTCIETDVFCIVLCWGNWRQIGTCRGRSWSTPQYNPQCSLDTERNGDSRRTCSNDDSLQRQEHALDRQISRLTVENQQFRKAGSQGLAEIATAVGQARLDSDFWSEPTIKVRSASKAVWNLARSEENLRE